MAKMYQISSDTLTEFANEARRLAGTTESLTTDDMLAVFQATDGEAVSIYIVYDETSGEVISINGRELCDSTARTRITEILQRLEGMGGNGGSVSWNDITDKPFGDEGETVEELLPNTEITFSNGSFGTIGDFPYLVKGESYRVIWDGETYDCTAVVLMTDGSEEIAIGNIAAAVELGATYDGDLPQTNEPFFLSATPIQLDEGIATVFFVAAIEDVKNEVETSSHSVGVGHMVQGVSTLDAKYLPKATIMEWIDAYIGETLGGDY